MAVEKGDILTIEKSSEPGEPRFAVALQDGDPTEVPVRTMGGKTFRIDDKDE